MSKKPAKSDRSVDLPEWADDVTPADEVMRKFYAPTGTFKSGPIASSQPESQPITPTVPHDSNSHGSLQHVDVPRDTVGQESPIRTQTPSSLVRGERQDEFTSTSQIPVTKAREEAVSNPLPSSNTVPLRTFLTSAAIQTELSPQPKSPLETERVSASDNLTSYDVFARKWKMYLYPGQLAVMRILYELTYAVDTTECFTRYSEIARATKMTRRNCINVVNSLVNRGFVERLEVRNDASAKGIWLRIHLEPTA